MRRLLLNLSFVASLIVIPLSIQAQWVQTPGIRFAVRSILELPEDAGTGQVMTLFVGSDTGVYRSIDSGASWTLSGLAGLSVNALALQDTILYAATATDGVFRTNVRDTNWSAANSGIPTPSVTALAVIGSNLLAGTTSGVSLSTDGGTSWKLVLTDGLSNSFGRDNQPSSVRATVVTMCGTNIWASTDSGATWFKRGARPNFVNTFAWDDSELFAVTGSVSGVQRTRDTGLSWTAVNTGLPIGVLFQIHTLAIVHDTVSANPTSLFVGTLTGVYLSKNDAASWTYCGIKDYNINCLLAGPVDNASMNTARYLYAGSDTGVWRRPLSELIETPSAVAPAPQSHPAIASFPNPLSATASIQFKTDDVGLADVTIENLLGVDVAHLFSGELGSGEHTFTWDARNIPAGMYDCIVRMNGRMERTAMIVTH